MSQSIRHTKTISLKEEKKTKKISILKVVSTDFLPKVKTI